MKYFRNIFLLLSLLVLCSVITPGDTFAQTPPPVQISVYPVNDSYVDSRNPDHNYDGVQGVSVHKGDGACTTSNCTNTGETQAYLRFPVAGIPLGSIINAVKLTLYVNDKSPDGGKIYKTHHTDWDEDELTWRGRPNHFETVVADIGSTMDHEEEEIEVTLPTSTVSGNGIYSFVIKNNNQDEAWYANNRTNDMPWLHITYTPPATAPASPIVIDPGDNPQNIINAAAANSTFLFKAGTHRGHQLSPRGGDTYLGEPGAVLNGSAEIPTSSWSLVPGENDLWVANGLTTYYGDTGGECDGSQPRCGYVEQLFYNNERIPQSNSIDAVDDDNKWFYDYTNNKIYLGLEPDWPAETSIEVMGSMGYAFWNPNANNVTIKNLEVMKYGTPTQQGVLHIASNWLVENVTSIFNHSNGFNIIGNNSTVKNSAALYNGKSGLGATGTGNTYDNVEAGYNNTAGFNFGWDAGGSKFAFSTDLIVKNSYIHHNYGPGLWTDIDNTGTLYEDNRVEHNAGSGIFHEISFDAIIRDNIVKHNGAVNAGWIWGAGIQIANSSDVEVYNNTLEGNTHAIMGSCQNRGTWTLDNLNVHNNTVTSSGQTGAAEDFNCGVYTTKNLDFEDNDYFGSASWGWDNAERNWTQWQGYGHDDTGSYTP